MSKCLFFPNGSPTFGLVQIPERENFALKRPKPETPAHGCIFPRADDACPHANHLHFESVILTAEVMSTLNH
ncbi:hypothetical protein APED_23585 [Acanthopleuribacter pedis]